MMPLNDNSMEDCSSIFMISRKFLSWSKILKKSDDGAMGFPSIRAKIRLVDQIER
jgi:hypothetical protein